MNATNKTIVLTSLMAALNFSPIAQATDVINPPDSHVGCYVYMAAGLFSTSQTDFNTLLTANIEAGLPPLSVPPPPPAPPDPPATITNYPTHKTFLPQRDGFEFSNLQAELAKVLPADQVVPATHIIIYYLDIGYFIPHSHVVNGLMDEPLDPGVIVENVYGRIMGKPVIQYKTDSLSLFGSFGDPLGGIHFFPPFNSNLFILARFQTLDTLSNKVNYSIDKQIDKQFGNNPNYNCKSNAWDFVSANVKNNPVIMDLMKGVGLLFDNVAVDDAGNLLPPGSMNDPAYYDAFLKAIHTSKGLERVANNYANAVAADPSRPGLVFKAYPRISNESEVLPK